MTITIDHEMFLNAMLNGNWFDTKAVRQEVGDYLKALDPNGEWVVCNKPTETYGFYNLWTKEGWENEKKRLLYIATLREPTKPTPQDKPKPLTRNELMEQLNNAIVKGDMAELTRIQEQLKGMK